MTIDSITINLKDKEPIQINKVTDLRLITLDFDEDEDFIVTTVEIDYNNEDLTISATPQNVIFMSSTNSLKHSTNYSTTT